MEVTLLQFTWFIILGIAFAIYAILDGFDLGAGILYLFTSSEEERTTIKNSIGPVWDGNEVWLIAGGGGLFAAFPLAYATIFSSMYFAVMLLIWSLILRAVSFEFRQILDYKFWKRLWDGIFILSSFIPAILLGVAVGNVLTGLHLTSSHTYSGSFFDLLNPFALIIGLLVLFVFMTHGATFLIIKTEGPLQEKMRRLFSYCWIIYLALFILANITLILTQGQLLSNLNTYIIPWIIPLLSLVAIVLIWYYNSKNQYLNSFYASIGAIIFLMLSIGFALYPNIVLATDGGNLNILLSEAASSELALTVMLVVAVIGLPLVFIYEFIVYRIFLFKKPLEISGYH